jgi:hypothetical protein
MRVCWLLLLLSLSLAGHAAQRDRDERRTYPDPACAARDVDPEKCVIDNGDPRRVAGGEPPQPLTPPPPAQPSARGAFTPGGAKAKGPGGSFSSRGGK